MKSIQKVFDLTSWTWFFNLWFYKGNTQSVETIIQILNFDLYWASNNVVPQSLIVCWVAAPTHSSRWTIWGLACITDTHKQHSALCWQCLLYIVFCIFSSHHVYNMLIYISGFWGEGEKQGVSLEDETQDNYSTVGNITILSKSSAG